MEVMQTFELGHLTHYRSCALTCSIQSNVKNDARQRRRNNALGCINRLN
jgi:hypothetical protein